MITVAERLSTLELNLLWINQHEKPLATFPIRRGEIRLLNTVCILDYNGLLLLEGPNRGFVAMEGGG